MAEEERTVLLANRLQQGPVTEPLRLLGRMFHIQFFHTVLPGEILAGKKSEAAAEMHPDEFFRVDGLGFVTGGFERGENPSVR